MYRILTSLNLAFGIATAQLCDPIAAVSWKADERLDVFGIAPDGTVWHKWHSSTQGGWEPHEGRFESLGTPGSNLTSCKSTPTAISWDQGRIDLFLVDADGKPWHRYFQTDDWKPWAPLWDDEAGKDLSFTHPLAVASWGIGRFDVVGRIASGHYVHKYLKPDGWSIWEEWDDVEFSSPPAIVSWGANRFDVFGVAENQSILHKFWDSEKYNNGWEDLWSDDLGDGFKSDSLLATSPELGRMDVWAIGQDASLWHTFWAPGYYHPWENLGGSFDNAPKVVHWSAGRIDIVGHPGTADEPLLYKYYDHGWTPGFDSFQKINGSFNDLPAVSSFGKNNLNIFGLSSEGELLLSYWNQTEWKPGFGEWYSLGNISDPYAEKRAQQHSQPGPQQRFKQEM